MGGAVAFSKSRSGLCQPFLKNATLEVNTIGYSYFLIVGKYS